MEENTENYKEISKEELEAILKGKKHEYISQNIDGIKTIRIENKKFLGTLFIDIEDFFPSRINIEFNECYINELTFISRQENTLETNRNIKLNKSHIEFLNFYSGHLDEFKISDNCKVNSIQIKDFGEKAKLGLSFLNIEKFFIENSSITTFGMDNGSVNWLNLNECKIYQICVDDINIEHWTILSCEVGGCYIKNGNFGTLSWNLSNVSRFCNFEGGDFEEIHWNGGKIDIDLLLEKVNIKNVISFTRGIFTKRICFSGGIYNKINITLNEGLNINEVKFYLTPIPKYFYIEESEGFLNKLTFENADIIAGTLIKISDIPINNITFNNSVNAGNIIFSGVKSKKLEGNSPTLKIHNSDLGKTTFIDCDFEEMELDFKSSKITEVFLAGTRMPKPENISKELDNEQKRLAFGQLKKIYDNRGDTVTANEYFAEEMNVLYSDMSLFGDFKKLPKKEYKRFKWFNKIWDSIKFVGESFSEKSALWLNKYSSNHGTSWGKAVIKTLLISAGLFSVYGYSIGLRFSDSPTSCDTFKEFLSFYFEFLNPVHKNNFIEGTKLVKPDMEWYTRLIDGGSRIINSYFIYQLIQAFRKHRRGS